MDEEGFEQFDKEETTTGESHKSSHNEDAHNELNRKVDDQDEFSEDLACSVCFCLAVQPTSLTCGHTCCRVCLASWYFASGKKQCPLCGQAFQGHPKINIHIQNMIAKLCPRQLMEREQTLGMSEENTDILRRFEEVDLVDKQKQRNASKAFCLGIAFSIIAYVIAYLAWYWQFCEQDMLASKPVQLWRPLDVKAWLEKLPWTSTYSNKSIESNIDGNMLLVMDDESVLKIFNVSDPEHQKALLSSVALLKEQGTKMPLTIWEYKDIFPERCIFLAYGLQKFPRVTILYIWLYLYDDMFLPFVKATRALADEADTISTSHWINFLFYVVVSPQWLVIVIANQLLTHQFCTLLVIIINAILVQLLEILWITSYFRNNNLEERDFLQISLQYGGFFISAFMMMVMWPVIPKCIADLIFFNALYMRPFWMCRTVHARLRV